MTPPTSTTLSEARSKRLLAEHGVPVLPERSAASADAAVVAASEVGFPVVVKLCGDTIAHKTERGLVRLNLGDEASVREAAGSLLGAATPADGDVELLVAPMARGSRELIAGLHTDAQFGRVVMIGFGGILAEAIADVSFRLVPLTPVDADEMIDELRTQALLGPFRGEPAVDRGALAATLLGLSALAAAAPEVVSVDVNPLIVVDGRPVAVDALVEVRTGPP
jgi:acetate---CoA ligase (ADP-forming) subunit beta